jgi:hypothetical protein
MALLNAQGKEIVRRFSGAPLVVIYCHNTKANGMLLALQHWDFARIRTMIESRLGKKVNVYTLDPMRPKPTNIQSTADIVMDGFSNDFISMHQSMFDMLILPDCGGPWSNAAYSGETNISIDMIERLLTMIKPGGYLCMNKFMNVSENTIQSYFQKKGISAEKFQPTEETPYVILTRPAGTAGGRRRKTARRRVKRSKTNRKHRG